MKNIPLVLVFLSFTSCATAIPYSRNQRCAAGDMVLQGVSEGQSESSSISYVQGAYGPIPITTNGVTASEQVHCSVPHSDEDKCHLDYYRREIEPIAKWNSGEGGRITARMFTYLLIVPGIVVNIAQDAKKKEVLAQYAEWQAANPMACDRAPAGK